MNSRKVSPDLEIIQFYRIDLLYQNVLGRSADDDGLAFYTNHFNEGTMTRAAALIGFAESPENVTLVAPQIEDGIWLAS